MNEEEKPSVDLSKISVPAMPLEFLLDADIDSGPLWGSDSDIESKLSDSGKESKRLNPDEEEKPKRLKENSPKPLDSKKESKQLDSGKESKSKKKVRREISNGSSDEYEEESERRLSFGSSSSGFKRERSESPDQRSIRVKTHVRKARGYTDTDPQTEMEHFDVEISNMSVSVDERLLLDFTRLDEHRQKNNLLRLDETSKMRIVKQFKIWRESKSGSHNWSLTDKRIPQHGIKTSWESFMRYAQEGDKRIFEEIQKRRSTVQQKSLGFLRESIHEYCIDYNDPCLIFLKENGCACCNREGYAAPSRQDSFENRNKEDSYLEGQVQLYLKALRERESRINRGAIGYSRSVHTREPRPERLLREDFSESKYLDRGYSRSNERGRLAPNPFASKDESFHYEGYEHPQSDRAYPLASSEARESRLYAQRSSRRSSAAVRGYPTREVDPDDSSRMSQLDLQALSQNYFSLQRQLTQTSQHAAEKRENFSERLTRVEGSQHALTDRLDSQGKLTQKQSGTVEKLKKVAFCLQKESAQLRVELDQLRAIVSRLMKKDQKLTDQKNDQKNSKE